MKLTPVGFIAYCAALFIWHLICSHHYNVQIVPHMLSHAVRRHGSLNGSSQLIARGHAASRAGANSTAAAASAAVAHAAPKSALTMVASKMNRSVAEPSAAPADRNAIVRDALSRLAASNGVDAARCPNRKPIHCVLTAQGTVYQTWQV